MTRVFPRGRPFPGAAASLRPAASGSRRGPDIALVSAASARARHATAASAQASLHRSL